MILEIFKKLTVGKEEIALFLLEGEDRVIFGLFFIEPAAIY